MKKKVAVIVDNLMIAEWQYKALAAASSYIDIVVVFNCTNNKPKRKYIKNALYFLLNIFCIRNSESRLRKIEVAGRKVLSFEALNPLGWQQFPTEVIGFLERREVDFVVKFGMGLLLIEDSFGHVPILSYHHGDPRRYRGRPAGFYELLSGENLIGIIVQVLNNKLDGGTVLALGHSKVYSHSYGKTIKSLFSNSEHLLCKAVINLSLGLRVNVESTGDLFRLPSNFNVIRFSFVILANLGSRALYGCFFEKKWCVAVAKLDSDRVDSLVLDVGDASLIPIPPGYTFLADPFFSAADQRVRVEAMNRSSGLGEILEFETLDFSKYSSVLTDCHHSYPFSFCYRGKEFLLPEVASHSPPFICETAVRSDFIWFLNGLEDRRIVDATLFSTNGFWFLFFGDADTGGNTLHLWISDSPFGDFAPHPRSPLLVSPVGSRMGGCIVESNGAFYRFGQDNSGDYGESLVIYKIQTLSHRVYDETFVRSIRLEGFKGPHCINFNTDMNMVVFDFYRSAFSLGAGLRRVKHWISAD